MLPKQYRLQKKKDFDILFKEGRFVSGDLVDLKVWQIDPEKYPRREYTTDDLKIGFVVSKKIVKSAVKRNRIKRQMREVVRLILKDSTIKKGFMVAVLAKSAILGKDYKEIEKSVLSTFASTGLLR